MIRRWVIAGIWCWVFVFGVYGWPYPAAADEAWVSKVVSVQGRVFARRHGETDWHPVHLEDTLFAGDRIRVEVNSRAGIILRNDAVLRLDQNTTLVFTEIEQETTFILKLLKGAAHFFSRRPRSLKIVTPFVNGVVEGTEFYVQVEEKQTRIDLFEGRILVQNPYGEVRLVKGQEVTASAGSAPVRQVLVRPRDSVQWALYYPPVLAVGPDETPPELKPSMALFNQGRISDAIDTMDRIERSARDASYFTYRAGLMLNVGQVSRARTDIQQALALEPENSEALALKAVIAAVQNRKANAIEVSREAVRLDPQSPTTHIALSYALQAEFKLQEALQAAQHAVDLAPEKGIARARLAELQLSVGELDQGVRTAQKAAELDPHSSQAHTILGFAFLTQIKTDNARQAFNQAIALDSAAPLPRLGLGLADIRDGNLEQGRSQIEIAVGLDPANALMRSYLGKAYFDEKRGPKDEEQLEIAKTLDPNDPTPWFYDAIRKQTLNRPVEALQDLQNSIGLNDNRAVYRSRLLLDDDLAARSASLGRIYNDLDFQHLALAQGYESLHTDSTNYSAHRLLADSYAAKPRHEIARVSELLQSQLFQPLNLTPVQAQMAETDTSFMESAGPSALSVSEFNPLFTRNRLSLQASGMVASDDTWGDEIAVTGLYDRLSASVGQFHYQTDGVRENNDYSQDLRDIFLQGSLTPDTSIQAEYRSYDVDRGDRQHNFDGEFSLDFRDEEAVEKLRLGGRHAFSSRLETIASFSLSDVTSIQNDIEPNIPADFIWERKMKRNGYMAEIRSDYKSKRFSLISGIGHLDENQTTTTSTMLGPPLNIPVPSPDEKDNIIKTNLYSYFLYRPSNVIEFSFGASADFFRWGEQIDANRFNPKFGFLWQPGADTTIRLAAFSMLSYTALSAQTIEPTNISGFNQFFDDPSGSEVWTYGAAATHTFSETLFGGIEFTQRYLDIPEFGGTSESAVYFPWEETSGFAYLYWMPKDYLAVSGGYQYERFDREENALGYGIEKATTEKIPLGIKLFHPIGFSFGFKATYYIQEGDFLNSISGQNYSGSDNFWIFDAEMSYRIPKRYGRLTVGVKNLLDEEFSYQDTDLANPELSQNACVYCKLTLSF